MLTICLQWKLYQWLLCKNIDYSSLNLRNPLIFFEPQIKGIPPEKRCMATINFNKDLNIVKSIKNNGKEIKHEKKPIQTFLFQTKKVFINLPLKLRQIEYFCNSIKTMERITFA